MCIRDRYKKNLIEKLRPWVVELKKIQNTEKSNIYDLSSNTIDAFTALVDIKSSNITYDDWIEKEKERQRQKSLSNKIGDLHEIMIWCLSENINKKGKDKDGIVIYDLYDDSAKWIAEIKNKWNTTKGDDRKSSYIKLDKGLRRKEKETKNEYTAFYVTILRDGHSHINRPFEPSDNTKKEEVFNKKIRHVDGETFYELITGDKDSLMKAFIILIEVLEGLFDGGTSKNGNDEKEKLLGLIELSLFRKKINILTDPVSAFKYLPGIGLSTAKEIVRTRKEFGFEKIEDLMKVKGIGEKSFNRVKELITV